MRSRSPFKTSLLISHRLLIYRQQYKVNVSDKKLESSPGFESVLPLLTEDRSSGALYCWTTGSYNCPTTSELEHFYRPLHSPSNNFLCKTGYWSVMLALDLFDL